ncbi:Uncharacterised protein [Mycobacteroides abscessus subsp. abscessus]|uniref:hypothetical protein n=1 Tax=Mycobacteroides abscessus TaxID=36809 RepID=UPI00092A4EF0|nr:hypothetical protein [Mycobacteroides abscessus]SIM00775.1 Uncharacterised protein [Mycobacteroides abscessus subsp. abscessus]SLD01611.1 Uncharacterised protein [Mycobacteroides abscessus subsp. abscessus]
MFINELIDTADAITGWTGLGIKLSPELEKAIELHEAIRWTEVGHAFNIDIAKLTPADVEATIHDLAQHIVTAEAVGQNSPLLAAKLRLLKSAAAQVIQLARQFAPEARDQLAVEFDKHAQAYTEAVRKLPEELTSESLIAAGPDAVSAYSVAQAEVEHLRQVSRWVSDVRVIPGLSAGADTRVLNVLRPSDIEQLHRLDTALRAEVDPALGRIDPVFAAAAREGIEFGINLPAESHRIRSELAYSPTIEFND